jgi:glycosyltransferase involved in cell wall biosynthesis
MDSPLKLSVIICTYNREKYIYNVLRSLAENPFPTESYELLVIDNNSTDGTAPECDRFQAAFPAVDCRRVVEAQQGLSHARNRGVDEAVGDILIYVDDDATVNPGYLQAFHMFFIQHPAAMAAGGPVMPVYEAATPRWLSRFTIPLITGQFHRGDRVKAFGKSGFPRGGNAGYRREVFHSVGRFNLQLGRKGDSLAGAEEKDIFDKMRAQRMPFYYVPGAVLYHIIPPDKLTNAYFNALTLALGRSERLRTQAVSRQKYITRLLIEAAKWGVSIVLCAGYTLLCVPQKGWKLLRFRWNVTKGLL